MGDEELRIGLLGAFSVELGGMAVVDGAWRLRKAKTLVKLLALAPDQRLHSDQVAELLWGDRDPASARNNLHQAIFAARRALGSSGLDGRRYLELQDDVLELAPHDPVLIDAVEFEQAAALAREERDPNVYRAALEGFRGELLPEDRYEEWTASRRERLNELRLALAIELAELEAPTEPAAAIARLREVLVDEPLHEPAHRALMRLYAGSGRRQEALAQFHDLKRGLRREFDDEPDDETRRLYQQILTRSLEQPEPRRRPTQDEARPSAASANNLPRQLTSFIGRERELAEAATLLRSARLLTLTGAGGSGKTRLSFQLALERLEDYPDGTWPVELAALGEPELLGPALAQALDMRLASGRAAEVALAAHIGERRQLLLLDNCEHLVEAVARLVEALLRLCPNLTVLATSREPLRVPGEVTWRVPSLSLPRLGDGALADGPLEAESVRLFAARASQATSGFTLDDGNAGAIATLCHRLDGMPLAIELAAARVAVLTPAQIVERLDDSLDLLSAGARTAMTRQQTLRATLAWSVDLLDGDEQVLLRRLAVFAGSFGLDAAEEVCGEQPLDRGEIVSLLGRLVDKSLVHVEEGAGEHRYRLLETVRQYAAEQLVEAGERETFERRHRERYVELAESDPTPAGDLPARERLRRLDLERENLRAALASALANDPQAGLRLAVALWRFWLMRGYLAEGNRWLDATLGAAPEHTAARAHALLAACLIGLRRGDHEGIHDFGAESVAIFAELGDRAAMFDAVEVSAAHRTTPRLGGAHPRHRRLVPARVPAGAATARSRAGACRRAGRRPPPGAVAAELRTDRGRERDRLPAAPAGGHRGRRSARRRRGGDRLHPGQPGRGRSGRGRLRPCRGADRREPRPLPAPRRQAGGGLRAQRARQPGPLQWRPRAGTAAARAQPRSAQGDRRPARRRDHAQLPGGAAGPLRRPGGRPRRGRARAWLVGRERRPDRPQRGRALPGERGPERGRSRCRPRPPRGGRLDLRRGRIDAPGGLDAGRPRRDVSRGGRAGGGARLARAGDPAVRAARRRGRHGVLP